MPDITGKEKVDRLPVLASQNGECQLLGVPKLQSGSGESQAEAILDIIKKWKLDDKVQGKTCMISESAV